MPTKNAVRSKLSKTGFLFAAVLFSLSALAQQTPRSASIAAGAPAPVRWILVSIPDRKLALIENGEVKEIYPVAVGKESTPSPSGDFRIVNRVTDPTYYHAGKIIPPGPANPVGTRWMGLSERGYGIHGTNAPRSIGRAASHGCIRMAHADLQRLFVQVRVGDVVEIRAERDEETAAIFGGVDRTELADAAPGAKNAGE